MKIELLEARIAPASLTFADLDGDLVTISSTKGTRDQLVTATGGGAGLLDHEVQVLDLSFTTDFDGATISITATPQAGKGDGFVNIGYINATGRVLGSVTVDGDLGAIDVGNTAKSAFALQTLTVHSMGLLGTSTGGPSDLTSDFAGSVRAINVKTDLSDVYLHVFGSSNSVNSSLGALTLGGSLRAPTSTGLGEVDVAGNLGPVNIGGSVIGGALQASGRIHAAGSIGNVTIGGDLLGGTAIVAGSISSDKTIGDVTIGGDLRGGVPTGANDFGAGEIYAANGMGNLKIGGSIIGTGKEDCGTVRVGSVKNVTVGGSLIGGTGLESGAILVAANGNIGNVTIGGDLKGSGGKFSGSVVALDGNIGNVTVRGGLTGGIGARSGSILAATADGTHGHLGVVKIGGEVRGGGNLGGNDLAGSISAHDAIAAVSIGGTLQGGDGYQSGSIVGGKIGAVSIYKRLSGGFGIGGGSIISDTDIGAISVGDDIAGGTASGSFTAEATGEIFANGSIASVTVGGSLLGNSGNFSGSIRAKSVGPVNIHGNVTGAGGQDSGSIQGIDKITSVTIGGTLRGGDLTRTGSIYALDGIIGPVSIGGNLFGGGNNGGDQYAGSIVGHAVGSVTIHGDVVGGAGSQSGAILTETTIGNVTIGGSLVGNAGIGSGRLAILITQENPVGSIGNVTIGGSVRAIGGIASGGIYGAGVAGEHLGAVKIGGDWEASSGDNSGQITMRQVASITLEGSLIGGRFHDHAGYWVGDKVGSIVIGGDLVGGKFTSSGSLDYASSTSVRIEGSILGGTADFTGSVRGKAGSIFVGHDIRGGDVTTENALYNGAIVGASVTSVTIGGSLIAGRDNGSGSLGESGVIVANVLGSVVIKGSIVGNPTQQASILGASSIKSINVAGRVEFGLVNLYLSGAQLGTLTVGGDWIASDVSVGLVYHSSFGNGTEALSAIPGANPTVAAKIASIVIGGQVLGTANPSVTYGFGAEEITSFRINGNALKLKPGAHTDKFAGTNHAGSAVAVGVTPASLGAMDDGFAVHVFEV